MKESEIYQTATMFKAAVEMSQAQTALENASQPVAITKTAGANKPPPAIANSRYDSGLSGH